MAELTQRNGALVIIDEWCIDDVRQAYADLNHEILKIPETLSTEQCIKVMKIMVQYHDCNYGINWEFVQECCKTMLEMEKGTTDVVQGEC